LQYAIDERGGRLPTVQPEFTPVGEDKIIGSTIWLDEAGGERYHVLTIRDGQIVDMQGCATRRQAERFARRRGRGS
jgi:hypothetical protein